MKAKFDKVMNYIFAIAILVSVISIGGKYTSDIYMSLKSTGSIESFEVERGGKSLTCVTSWVATQATMSCLPTQWMEAEVVYDQADFEGTAEEALVPTNEYEYPVCSKEVPPQGACWTKNGTLYPGYVVQ